jgi:hypothetical protein
MEYVSIRNFKTRLGLAETPETSDPELYKEMVKVYNALKALAVSIDMYTGSPIFTVEATVDISYGQLIDLYDGGGVLKARLADASGHSAPCKAFCSEPSGITSGATGNVTLRGFISIGGVTPGTVYWLSTTAGSMTSSKPTGGGNFQQVIGFGLDTTTIYFNPELANISIHG